MNEFADYRILIVDDEKGILKILDEILRKEGFVNIHTATNCAEAIKIVKNNTIALFILDIMLPDGDGFSLLKQIRQYSNVPAIFLTAKGESDDKIKGLGLGADDYIVKPFLTQELILRIMALLRRTYSIPQENIIAKLSDRIVNFETASVVCNNFEVNLTAKEFVLLKKLYENKNKVVTNDALCMAAWGDEYYGYENTLMVHIRHLRKKIEKKPSEPKHLLTVKGIGYRLVIDNE